MQLRKSLHKEKEKLEEQSVEKGGGTLDSFRVHTYLSAMSRVLCRCFIAPIVCRYMTSARFFATLRCNLAVTLTLSRKLLIVIRIAEAYVYATSHTRVELNPTRQSGRAAFLYGPFLPYFFVRVFLLHIVDPTNLQSTI